MRGEHRRSRGDRATPTSHSPRAALDQGRSWRCPARRFLRCVWSRWGASCGALVFDAALNAVDDISQRQRVEHVPRPGFPVLLRNDSGEAPPTTLRIIQAWAWSCRVSDGALNTVFHDQALTSSSDA
jgi:hypothetical protein